MTKTIRHIMSCPVLINLFLDCGFNMQTFSNWMSDQIWILGFWHFDCFALENSTEMCAMSFRLSWSLRLMPPWFCQHVLSWGNGLGRWVVHLVHLQFTGWPCVFVCLCTHTCLRGQPWPWLKIRCSLGRQPLFSPSLPHTSPPVLDVRQDQPSPSAERINCGTC